MAEEHAEAAEIGEMHDGGLAEKLRDGRATSSSDSEGEKPAGKLEESSPNAKVRRLFGREWPVYHVLGGGKFADLMLWRNKKISAGVLGVATAVWILFELLDYHLIPLIANGIILFLASLFLWSNAKALIRKSPPRIPVVRIPEEPVVKIAHCLSYGINKAFAVLKEIALGKSLKKFLVVITALWLLSVVGSSADFLTLFYILFVILHAVPVLYEKYDDKVDGFAEKVMEEIKKHYAAVDMVLIRMIRRGSKNKKQQ